MNAREVRHYTNPIVVLSIVLIFSILFLIILLYANVYTCKTCNLQNNKQTYEVIIDAGHGGDDEGVVYHDVKEKDINLAIALHVGKQLEDKGYQVGYTRIEDVAIQDEERMNFINKHQPTLFISIHTEENEDSENYGYTLYGKIKQLETFELTKDVMNQMKSFTATQCRGIIDQDLHPVRLLNDMMIPGVLIRCGYVANENDYAYLSDAGKRDTLANTIAQGVIQYLDNL